MAACSIYGIILAFRSLCNVAIGTPPFIYKSIIQLKAAISTTTAPLWLSIVTILGFRLWAEWFDDDCLLIMRLVVFICFLRFVLFSLKSKPDAWIRWASYAVIIAWNPIFKLPFEEEATWLLLAALTIIVAGLNIRAARNVQPAIPVTSH